MSSRSAISVLGYAIVLVIIMGVLMIISAPMLANKHKNDQNRLTNQQNNSPDYNSPNSYEVQNSESPSNREIQTPENNYTQNSPQQNDLIGEMRRIESSLTMRIDNIERTQNEVVKDISSRKSDKYDCKIEGYIDENGTIIQIKDQNNSSNYKKFVFVCEYMK